MKKQVCFYLALILIMAVGMPLIAIASDVAEADFSGSIAIANSGTTATNVSTVLSLDADALVSVYNIDKEFDYTAILGTSGTDAKYMPGYGANPWCIFIPNIDEDQTKYNVLYLGHSDLGSTKYYFPGSTGMTVLDNSTIEMGSNASWTINGFLNTTAGASRYDVNKPGAFEAGISTDGLPYSSVYNVWPVIAASGSTDTSGTSHVINTGTLSVGDLSLIASNYSNSSTTTTTIAWPSGYFEIFQKVYDNGEYGATVGMAYKVATGGEGTTVTSTTNTADTGKHGYYVIAAGSYSIAYLTNGTAATASSGNANPPSCTQYYNANADCLSIAVAGLGGSGTPTFSAYPTGYTIGQINNEQVAVASKYVASTTADPGTFTNTSVPWASNTICIYPGKITASAAGIASAEIKRTYTVSPAITSVFEGFEWGADGDSVAISGGTVTWSVATAGTSVAEIDTAQAYAGTRSMRLYRDGTNDVAASFLQSPLNSQFLSFYFRKDADGLLRVQHGNGTREILFRAAPDENIQYYFDGWVNTGTVVSIATWYNIQVNNINWATATYDIYLDASPIARNIPMFVSAESPNEILFTVNSGSGVEIWVDNITISTCPSLNLYLNDVLKDTEYMNSGVPDNTQSYQVGSTATPYIENAEITVGGTQAGYWEWGYPDTMASTLTNGTGTATGSPITLASGANTITVTAAGNFVIKNAFGWGCKAESNGATVTNSPVWCPSPATRGTTQETTIAVTGTGTITVTLYQVFHDQSANTNDGIPSFRTTSSDADVSATIASFAPIDLATAPAYSVEDAEDFYTHNSTMTGQFTTGGVSSAGGPPGFALISELATAGDVPNIWLFGIIATCIVIGGHLFWVWMQRRYGFRTMWPFFFTGLAVLGLFVALGGDTNIFDFWMVFFYILIFMCLMVMSRHTEVGGNTSTHGLIGFCAQSWIGLTLINRMLEGTFVGASDTAWVNNFAFTQDFKVFGIFSMPVINLDFFTKGIPSLLRWDYSFFGGNAQMFQYLLYTLTAVVAFILFGLLIGLLYNFFQGR